MGPLRIERLGHHGDGIAAGPVFAPRTLPGEIVSGTANGNRLDDVKIIEPSPHRVAPPCRHYKSCGGCQLQHASDSFVADWKSGVISRALAANDLNAELRPILTSETKSRRRATFSARRTKKDALVGFHARASDTIVDIPDCQLLHPDLMSTLDVALALTRVGASRRGALGVAATCSENGLDISVDGGLAPDGALLMKLVQVAQQHDLARLTWSGETLATRRPPVQRFGKAEVAPPPGAFLQATKSGEAALVAAVREIVGGARQVVDLFSGCGTFTLPLAEKAELHAVENSPAMLAALDYGWRHTRGLKKVTTESRDLFRDPLAPDELSRFDAAVLDPPRAGAEAQIATLGRSGIEKIAYVSCNPTTFARDARQLTHSGYRLDWVQPVDQFRWSNHVELAACFGLTSA